MYLDVRYLDGKFWLLLTEFSYTSPIYGETKIPQLIYNTKRYGFVTDFASIPPLAWATIGPPSSFAPEAAIHDWNYTIKTRSRVESDRIFKEALLERGVPKWKANVMYYAVRSYGWVYWNKREPFDPKRPWTDFETIQSTTDIRCLKRHKPHID